MKNLRVASKLRTLLLVGAVVAVGLATFVQSPTSAAPEPDCGPTREWVCVLPRCEECPEILFEGTICEKVAFENETGRVCSPA